MGAHQHSCDSSSSSSAVISLHDLGGLLEHGVLRAVAVVLAAVLAVVAGAGSRRGRTAKAHEPAAPVRLDAGGGRRPHRTSARRQHVWMQLAALARRFRSRFPTARVTPTSLSAAKRLPVVCCAAGRAPLPRVEGRREHDTPREAVKKHGTPASSRNARAWAPRL